MLLRLNEEQEHLDVTATLPASGDRTDAIKVASGIETNEERTVEQTEE